MIFHPLRNNYWLRRGYVTGSCMYNADLKHCYINIPKNASSFLRHYFKDAGWKHMFVGMNMQVTKNLVVLRDPIERWITGIAQHITTNILEENFGSTHFIELYNELSERIIFDQIVFDDHTEQQTWFLEPFELDNSVFFYCDSDLGKNLDSYFSTLGISCNFTKQQHINTSKEHFDNANLVEHFRNIVYNNKKYYNNLKSYFVRDYGLITSVDFYGK